MKKQKEVKKVVFYTQFTNTPNYKGKKMSDELLTIPDQTLTIRNLLDNHTRGIPLGVNTRVGEYFDTEIPRFDDLTDMIEYKRQLMERNKELNKLIREEKKEALEKLKKIPVQTDQELKEELLNNDKTANHESNAS
jgi:CRISPR/Cas system-associated endonuclease/helicase Cas3